MKKLSEHAEEILETLWVASREKGRADIGLERISPVGRKQALAELKKAGLTSFRQGRLSLLEAGLEPARMAVRRHRLAERLMADVFRLKKNSLNSDACRFEHMLHPKLEENICILLGHPTLCPHGNVIPPGACCEKGGWMVESTVRPLTSLKAGQSGQVAHLQTLDNRNMQKYLIMGILPGANIKVLRRFPSFVFQVGNTQVAVDADIAQGIYVKTS
jgi:DtxR family transcriptional regulator, Mn-dependent transcriptional regulator